MGVPAFYRWLVGKYPSIVSPAREQEDGCGGGERYGSAGGGAAYDNLYLDMNGIIHTCFHPEDEDCPDPATFDEVFEAMFDHIDRLFRIVRPRKLLYLAVDGVAPRAKMNQQRARRYKSAKAAKDADIEEKLLRERFRAQGKEVLPRETSDVSDPNVVTPGTEFMEKLSLALEYYIRSRLNCSPGWKDIKVILSDANVPGEGEHKIMSFIRAQRSMKNYDPNTRHCLYGLDSDLIMLALASHEVHFSILREDVLTQNQIQKVFLITEKNLTSQELPKVNCRGWFPRLTEVLAAPNPKLPKTPYQFLNIWVLREYLELELKIQDPVFKPDIERLIDDFIFICFLAGNDFIPHIPSLQTHECAVDLLIEVYKTTFNKMGGYIVDTDKVNDKHNAYLKVSRLEKFFHAVSMYEEKIFQKRTELRENAQRYELRKALENDWKERKSDDVDESCDGPDFMAMSSSTQCSISTINSESDITANTLELKQKLKEALRNKQDLFKNGASKHDTIKLGQLGWKSRFYRGKFDVDTPNEIGKLQNDMAQKYLEGLCWVLKYYFAAVPSWSWYYPFYYAPFASDMKGLSQFKICFTVDKPLRPFDQLMAVLPPESSYALPKCYSKLIHCEESPLQKFYPSEVEIDTDGKRLLWQCTIKLPFIDVELLLSATKTVEQELAIHEKRRNAVRQDRIFMRNSNALANNIAALVQTSESSQQKLPICSATSEIGGWLSLDDDHVSTCGFFRSPINNLENITKDQAISAIFCNPEVVYPMPRLLDNVRLPDKTVADESDIVKKPLWHTYPGFKPPPVSYSYSPQSSQSCDYSSKPADARWKPSTPAAASAEVRSAGTGWMGRGRWSAAAAAPEAPGIVGGSHYYGRGRGGAVAGEPQPRSSGYGGGFHGGMVQLQSHGGGRSDNGDRGTYNFRRGGGGGGAQMQKTAWRPVGAWARGGRGGGGGDGESGQR